MPPAGRSELLSRVPDAVIVAEPTQLNVVVAHKGAARWRCTARGVATHSSQPHLGDNAIYRMGRVLGVLDEYARDVVPQLAVNVDESPGLVAVPLRNPGISRTLGVVARRGVPLSPAADALLALLRKQMKGL